jgi:hypothetical protein
LQILGEFNDFWINFEKFPVIFPVLGLGFSFPPFWRDGGSQEKRRFNKKGAPILGFIPERCTSSFLRPVLTG